MYVIELTSSHLGITISPTLNPGFRDALLIASIQSQVYMQSPVYNRQYIIASRELSYRNVAIIDIHIAPTLTLNAQTLVMSNLKLYS